jgi:glycine dehydrogenase subunit 1
MSYISLSDQDRKEMLARIGVSSVGELFGCLPDEIKLARPLALPPAMAELALLRRLEGLAGANTFPGLLSFLGAGSYRHYIPAVVDYLSSRGEFISPYTPYQPEVSQGTLQVIFEYQTLVCQLTGLDISNASLYDGATAAAEAVLMANRLSGKPKVLVARSLHPQHRETIRTFIRNLGVRAEEVGFTPAGTLDLDDAAHKLDAQTSALLVQSPNHFGVVEDLSAIGDFAHSRQALFVTVVVEGLSLGLLEPPGSLGADIVCGEAQSFGLLPSFGGPGLGFMACKKEHIRQLPGRIAGQAKDADGRRGFVLTLSTREQHIRREKATSNICTNQAWCALRAAIFLETLGQDGLREMAVQNIQKAGYAASRLTRIPGVRRTFDARTFNEFVLTLPKDAAAVNAALRAGGVIGGLPLSMDYPELKNAALFCVTEMHTREEIDRLAALLAEALR